MPFKIRRPVVAFGIGVSRAVDFAVTVVVAVAARDGVGVGVGVGVGGVVAVMVAVGVGVSADPRWDDRTVHAISDATTNAELIEDCARLGYLRHKWRTLDPTYGHGRFWDKWRPENLVGCDLNPTKSPIGFPVDYTAIPYADYTFDAVVFDPPYKLNGTSTGKGPAASDEAYGVDGPYMPWQARHDNIRAGITECARVLVHGGMLLVKCQDQVCSGQVRWQTHEFTAHAATVGCRLVDMLLLKGGRQQPSGREQIHARRNYSTLLVFRKKANP